MNGDCYCGHAQREHAVTRSGAGMCKHGSCRCVQYEENYVSIDDDPTPQEETPVVDNSSSSDDNPFGGGGGFSGGGADGEF